MHHTGMIETERRYPMSMDFIIVPGVYPDDALMLCISGMILFTGTSPADAIVQGCRHKDGSCERIVFPKNA